MTLSLITDRRKEDVEYLLSLIAKGYGGMTGAEQTAWAGTSLKGAYNYTDLNRVESAVAYLLPIFASAGYNITTTTKTNWAVNNDMTVAEATRYLYNIAQIRQAFTYFTTTPPAPTTLVGLNYERANHIEKILLDAEILIFKLLGSFFYSGDLFCGENLSLDMGKYLPLQAYTWAEIEDIGNMGLAPVLFALNSVKDRFEIIGFDHDTIATAGLPKAHYTFAEQGARYIPSLPVMNYTNTNLTGWEACVMRGATAGLFLTSYTKQVIKPTQRNGSIFDSIDKNFLFSEVEITGSASASMAGEGSQYAGFVPVRKDAYGLGTAQGYWTRSPASGSTSRFVTISSTGTVGSRDALNSLPYIAWGFCI